MKAVLYSAPGRLEVVELPQPSIADGELLVAVAACGVCGTDVKTYLRGHPLIPPGSVLGHEVAGIVAESRHPSFAAGDRVAVAPYAPCGACPTCLRGLPSLCSRLHEAAIAPGGFAEYLRVPKRLADVAALHVPADVALEAASLAEPVACCVHGLESLGLDRVRTLLVIGDGPMGLMQAALARGLGVDTVVVAGATPRRLAVADRWADAVIDVRGGDLVAAARDALPGGADAVMVSVADAPSLEAAIALVNGGGVVNLFAGMPKGATVPLDLGRVHYDEVRVIGTFGFGPDDFRRALELIASGRMQVEDLITRRVPLDAVEDALRAAAAHEGIKTVVEP